MRTITLNSLRHRTAALCGLLLLLLVQVAAADQPLRPEKAFRYTATADASHIILRWDIEPGYYLYKKRISFAVDSPKITLGEVTFPPGETHEDEFFGKSEVFRNKAEMRIPYTGNSAQPVELSIQSQGCADMGLCYPPQTWIAQIALPAPQPGSLGGLIGQATANGTPLPAAEAFVVSALPIDAFNVTINWAIAEGYYIYKEQLEVSVLSGDAQAGQLILPAGTSVNDLEYGIAEVYYGQLNARLPLSRATPDAQFIELEVAFQGCKTESICYPPQTTLVAVDLPQALPGDSMPSPLPAVSEQSRLAALIGSGNLFAVMTVFVGLGLLLAFTPCVLPMVPILSGIIAGQGKDITTLRAFLLSLTYVLGMAVTYTLAGALFAAAGQQVQALLQQPWIIIAVTLLFVALAFAMFGAFTLQLPASLQTRINSFSNQQRAGTFIGTAIMGALSALVVTTCVAPPLVATLTVIAETGDVLRGGSALFALSMGMGLPLLVIGTSAGRLLPKAGAWMDAVKEVFGFMMLGMAIWMLERLLDGSITMLLWGALSAAAAGRLWLLSNRFDNRSLVIGRLLAGLFAVAGVIIFLAASQGGTNPLQSFAALSGTQKQTLAFIRIKSSADLDAELAKAEAAGQSAMLDFYADWCVSCKEMEHYTFTDPKVQAALANTRLLQADVTANDATDQALLQRMGIFGPPTIVFFNKKGQEINDQRVIGFQSADVFLNHLNYTLK
jgi:thioredoxin:protein disulfide reductase